jgi:hypothetical protein
VQEALADWRSFFGLLGGAAATLIGAMFVVVSIGSGVLSPERVGPIRVFLTATVVHLSSILFACALSLVPALDAFWFAIMLGFIGVAGAAYAGQILFVGIWNHNVDDEDRIWYAGLPFAGYAVTLAAAATSVRRAGFGLDLLAIALGLLLAAGIRNSWDMIVFFVLRAKGPPPP